MKPLQGNMIPESIVIVYNAHGEHCWVLEPGEGVQDVYAYYAKEFPDFKIRVFFCGVQVHARPVQEVPIEKLKRSPDYVRATEDLYITDKLDRSKMRPLSIDLNYNIEDGWQRYLAAKRDGWTTIPCIMRGR